MALMAVAAAVALVRNAAAQDFLRDSCSNPALTPAGIVPKLATPHFVLLAEESLPVPDTNGLIEQDLFILSLCNTTTKTPRGTQLCATREYYVARWHGDGYCLATFTTVLSTRRVASDNFVMVLGSPERTNETFTFDLRCGTEGDKQISRVGNNFTYVYFTSSSAMCPTAPRPPSPPGGAGNPPPPPPPGNNNMPSFSPSSQNEKLGPVAIFLIVLGAAAVAMLAAIIVDLRRENSMLRRIARGPEHGVADPEDSREVEDPYDRHAKA